jgi:hypothetical protein
VLDSVPSERMLMKQLDYNLLFRWLVGRDHARLADESAPVSRGPGLQARLLDPWGTLRRGGSSSIPTNEDSGRVSWARRLEATRWKGDGDLGDRRRS